MLQAKKAALSRFYFIVILESASSNFILPVTPSIIKNLHLPDYMFGLSYAGMSLTCFLFAPFWGKISSRIGRVNVYAIGCIGYSLAQTAFCFSTTQSSIMAARMLSGFFIGGINICHLSYLIDNSSEETLSKNVIVMSTLVSVFSSFGYLAGGVMGDISVFWTFMLQILFLFFCGIFLLLFLKDGCDINKGKSDLQSFFRDINPFSSFMDARLWMTRFLLICLTAFFLVYVAITACDQCFNYYLKDQFNFPSSYNGYLKSLMGFITLAANLTVCRHIVKKADTTKSFTVIFLSSAASLLIMAFMGIRIIFLASYIVFFALSAVNVTLQQSIVSKKGRTGYGVEIVAFYNSIQSLGAVAGSAAAGFLYEFSSNFSFLFGGMLFLAAVLLMKACNYKKDL